MDLILQHTGTLLHHDWHNCLSNPCSATIDVLWLLHAGGDSHLWRPLCCRNTPVPDQDSQRRLCNRPIISRPADICHSAGWRSNRLPSMALGHGCKRSTYCVAAPYIQLRPPNGGAPIAMGQLLLLLERIGYLWICLLLRLANGKHLPDPHHDLHPIGIFNRHGPGNIPHSIALVGICRGWRWHWRRLNQVNHLPAWHIRGDITWGVYPSRQILEVLTRGHCQFRI